MEKDSEIYEKVSIIKPNEVSSDESKKILDFLNSAKNANDIAKAIEFPNERDVGIKVAERIMAKREEGGEFQKLEQVSEIAFVGPRRFTNIVVALGGKIKQVEAERAQFRMLLLKNPNYFGNVVGPFEPVKIMSSNTSYEEIMCVGYNPQFERLEAVVHTKKNSGYGGDICSSGTPEYVRFYIDWDNSGTWTDLGMVSFNAYNIAAEKPLEYDVTLKIDPKEKICNIENLPKVKVILSWNQPPPANTPNFVPVWGNSMEARIQIDAWKWIIIKDLIELGKATISKEVLESINLKQEVAFQPKVLNLGELAELYEDKGVQKHRYAFAEVQKLVTKPALTEAMLAPNAKHPLIEAGFDIKDIESIIDIFQPVTDGNTSYEELACVGLNPNTDTLVGVLNVKLPNGYSGGLCTAGSHEYVAFWADYGSGWTYLGTGNVNVHDITKIPAEGLKYAVFLPVDFSAHRQPCTSGPKVVKIRAILSWQSPPPPANPDYVPVWGDRQETLIHIKPGPIVLPGSHNPYISVVGNMGIDDINSATGLATGTGVMAAFTAKDSPFGGVVTISGHIAFPPNTFGGGATPLKYKVFVRRSGEQWQPIGNSFYVKVTEQIGSIFTGPFNVKQEIDANGYYTYLEDLTGNERKFVEGFVLAKWVTGATMKGLWEIRMEAYDPVTNNTYPALNADSTSQVIKVYLDNERPKADVKITGYQRGADPTIHPGTDCGKFLVGDVIHGTYEVTDEHFNQLSLAVHPSGNAVSPNARSYPIVPTGGESGSWTLDTTGMKACGYIIRLWSEDRAIVNSGSIGWERGDSAGFCLEKA